MPLILFLIWYTVLVHQNNSFIPRLHLFGPLAPQLSSIFSGLSPLRLSSNSLLSTALLSLVATFQPFSHSHALQLKMQWGKLHHNQFASGQPFYKSTSSFYSVPLASTSSGPLGEFLLLAQSKPDSSSLLLFLATSKELQTSALPTSDHPLCHWQRVYTAPGSSFWNEVTSAGHYLMSCQMLII